MTVRRWLVVLGLAFLAGLIAALLTTDDARVVSAQIWVGASLVLMTIAIAAQAFAVRPRRRVPSRPLITRRRDLPEVDRRRPVDLVFYDRAVTTALGDNGAFRSHLQPRLVRLTEHHLRADTDVGVDPARVATALGSVAWLIDPDTTRVPTTDELDLFAHRITRGTDRA